MPRQLLTARFVAAAKPRRNAAGAAVRTEYPDAGCAGLHLIVQPTGACSWALRYRQPDRISVKITLGRAGEGGLSLAAARHAAAAARHRIERGDKPTPARPVIVAPVGRSVAETAAAFLELHAYRKTRLSTAWAAERIFNRLVLPAWHGRAIDSIRRRDVIDLVETIAVDRPYLANRTLGVLSKFFGWLCARDELAVSPAQGVDRPHKEEVRQRTLSDAELRALWLVCKDGGPFGAALRLMILCGGRRNEVSHLTWDELDEERRLWTLPSARSKNHREHVMPLATQAWAILAAMPHFAECDYVFTADGRSPIAGWDKAKGRLGGKAGLDGAGWRLHDLRRTCASGMQRLGVPVPVVEKALNHISGSFRGIVGTYQVHDYADEVRIAFQKWADHVEQLVGGKPAQVVKLRTKR
jgi:integrase